MTSSRRRRALGYSEDADRIELDALRIGDAAIDVGIDDEQLSGVLDDSAVDEMPLDDSELHRDDLAHDDSVGPIHGELRRRADLLQDAYPFDLKRATLVYDRQKPSALYEFLLAASISTGGTLLHDATRLFERVATQVIESYFGKNAKSMHFGWPRDTKVKSFQDAAKEIQARTDEWRWSPEEGLDPKNVNDEGCDFVVWLDSNDGRIGRLFVLGQCACGNNWQDKWGDLKIETLKRWFNPLSWVEPIKSFATPRHIADERILKEASRQAGLVFDRSRLVLAAMDITTFDDATVAAMGKITEEVRSQHAG